MTDHHHPRTAGEAVHRDNADLLPAAQMVKLLEWEFVPGRGYRARDYAIVDDGEGYDVYFGSESIAFIGQESGGDPLVEAKKVAEKHHHEYILSALLPAAQPTQETVSDTGARLLAIWNSRISGTKDGNREAGDRLLLAASFAAQAYEDAMDVDSGASALLRAFLTAMADPAHHDLDYLRACNRRADVHDAPAAQDGAEVEALRAFIKSQSDILTEFSSAFESKDAEIARVHAENVALKADNERVREALTVAANRLHRCSVDYDTGTHEFIETGEWANEARAAIRAHEQGGA